MTPALEEKLASETQDSWLRKAFREEWPTMGNHLLACGAAIGAATGFSHIAPRFLESDAAIAGIATGLDFGGYWGVFLPQVIYRDRKRLTDEDGRWDGGKIARKAGEYLGYIGIGEGIYTLGRFWGQYQLQKRGWDPATASATIQVSASAFFTLAFPIIRYAARQWSEQQRGA